MSILGTLRGALGFGPRSSNGEDTYDALNPKGRRRSASASRVRPEDATLTGSRRDRLDQNALDVWRNMSLLAWMIRRTLDYCCLFDFQPQTKDEGLNKDLRWLMARDSEAERIDYVGRYDWDDMRRVAESLKILTGDMFFVPLSEGTLQPIEGSYCRNPENAYNDTRWVNGGRLNKRGRVVQWNFREQILDTVNSYTVNDRAIPARNVWQHVQYEGRLNQIRGYSPIQAILNEMRDISETFDHARAKVKLDQIFGVAIFAKEDADEDLPTGVDEEGAEVDEEKVEKYDFGGGPVVMNRKAGEEVQMLTANNPGQNTQEFLKLCIQMGLKALDLPYNFFDESHTNFFGSRAAWNLYERSCAPRRRTQLRLHKRLTDWRLFDWTLPAGLGGKGEIILPRSMSMDDMTYRWVPRGLPWWKPEEELSTNIMAAAVGLKTWQGVCDENNLGIYEENVAALAREREQVAKHGFVMELNPAKLMAALRSPTAKPLAGGQAV
jgi:capsid protein